MSRLDFTAAEAILNACRANAEQAAEALTRALGGGWAIAPAEEAVAVGECPPSLSGPGLALVFKFAQGAAVLFCPPQLLPEGYASNPTVRARVATLAHELGVLLLPDSQAPVDCAAAPLTNLAAAWQRGQIDPDGGVLTLTLTRNEKSVEAFLVWPATLPEALLTQPAAPAPVQPLPPPVQEELSLEQFEESLANLPPYMRSLLRVKVQVRVALASTRQPVRRIVEIGPGSIIQFDKRCDEPLAICVGDQEIAVGEAVKVGDKFGLRINSMVLPQERFIPLGRTG